MVLFRRSSGSVDYVVAVEFKLRNWRRAIAQAFRYRNVANEAYVILDSACVGPALEHLDVFQRSNVGLLSFGTDGEMRAHFLPTPALPWSFRFARAFARELLARRTLPDDLPFIRATRWGVYLSPLRNTLAPEAGQASIADARKDRRC